MGACVATLKRLITHLLQMLQGYSNFVAYRHIYYIWQAYDLRHDSLPPEISIDLCKKCHCSAATRRLCSKILKVEQHQAALFLFNMI